MMTDQELNKGLLTLKVIWSAMLMSLAIYLFVGLQILANVPSAMTDETFGMLKMILYIIALATLIVTRFVRKLILSGKGQNRPRVQATRHPALQTYTTATILALAMKTFPLSFTYFTNYKLNLWGLYCFLLKSCILHGRIP